MDHKDEQSEVPKPLQLVVEDAYKVFRRHRPPSRVLDVCLNCCMSADLEQEMRRLPLRDLTAQHFYEYNTSAKSEVQPAAEIQYLLPRMLELIAEGVDVHHSTELFLDRVGRCPAGSLTEAERAVLDQFALSYFARAVCEEQRGWDSPLSVMLMFHIGGLDVTPLMAFWTGCDDLRSTLQFVRETYWEFWPEQEYGNAFAGDRPDFRSQLRTWLLDPSTRRRFANRLMDPEFLRLVAQEPCTGRVSLNCMVEAVFDHLSR